MTAIKGFENYLIFEDGKVYNQKYDRFLKPDNNGDRYLTVNLYKNNIGYKRKVHRLVGQAFIPNPENKPTIDHIDRDKTNNNVENLRWATIGENAQNKGYYANNKLNIKNISYDDIRDIYVFTKTINKIRHFKRLKTLDEAIAYKEQYELTLN